MIWHIGKIFGTSSSGSAIGALVEFAILVALAGYIYLRSRKEPVGSHNVNEWDDGETVEAQPQLASGGVA